MGVASSIKTFVSKKGNQIAFHRGLEAIEFPTIYSFACDLASEDTFVALNKAPTEEEERKWLQDMNDHISKKEASYISVYVNGIFSGGGSVNQGKLRMSHVGRLGIALRPNIRDEGIGMELMKTLIDEAKVLGLRLLTLSCFENNPKAIHMYEKLGFIRSGIIPGAISFHGEYIGEISYYLPLINH